MLPEVPTIHFNEGHAWFLREKGLLKPEENRLTIFELVKRTLAPTNPEEKIETVEASLSALSQELSNNAGLLGLGDLLQAITEMTENLTVETVPTALDFLDLFERYLTEDWQNIKLIFDCLQLLLEANLQQEQKGLVSLFSAVSLAHIDAILQNRYEVKEYLAQHGHALADEYERTVRKIKEFEANN